MKRPKREGYLDRLHESLGMRDRGPHKQSLKARAHESEGMEKHYHPHHPFAGVETMDKHLHHRLAEAHHRVMADHHGSKGRRGHKRRRK